MRLQQAALQQDVLHQSWAEGEPGNAEVTAQWGRARCSPQAILWQGRQATKGKACRQLHGGVALKHEAAGALSGPASDRRAQPALPSNPAAQPRTFCHRCATQREITRSEAAAKAAWSWLPSMSSSGSTMGTSPAACRGLGACAVRSAGWRALQGDDGCLARQRGPAGQPCSASPTQLPTLEHNSGTPAMPCAPTWQMAACSASCAALTSMHRSLGRPASPPTLSAARHFVNRAPAAAYSWRRPTTAAGRGEHG